MRSDETDLEHFDQILSFLRSNFQTSESRERVQEYVEAAEKGVYQKGTMAAVLFFWAEINNEPRDDEQVIRARLRLEI